ncbi:MAG: DUF3078 domain-containing protein [Prevotellaceae bacterium]|jgi:hypothetical protein|nr:DUF3078 domain-containing protein [Prevotellaceae bacterium]
MKKIFFIVCSIALFGGNIYAQDEIGIKDMSEIKKMSDVVVDTTNKSVSDTARWTLKGMGSLTYAQAYFKNWANGGDNSHAINAGFNGGAYYRKKRTAWDNDVALAFGIINTDAYGWQKNVDKINFASKYGYAINKRLFYTGLIDFKTQFYKGYNLPNDSVMVSNFMAPGYLTAALGMDYKPYKFFSVFVSPVTGRFTFVLNDSLSHEGAYGVDVDKKIKSQLGAYIKLAFNENIFKNVNLISTLDLFTPYTTLEDNQKIFSRWVVDWEVVVSMQFNKYIGATLTTSLLYDDAVKYTDKDGNQHGARVQFKEILGLGLTYKFN